jgi:hypothetical protein
LSSARPGEPVREPVRAGTRLIEDDRWQHHQDDAPVQDEE